MLSWKQGKAERNLETNGPDSDSSRARKEGQAIVDRTGSVPLPSSSSVDKLVRVWRDNGRVRGQVAEGERLEASVTEKANITGEGVQTAGL